MLILLSTIQFFLVPTLSPLLVGVIRKAKAYLQGRNGASVFQPYRDLWKLIHKDEVESVDASWIFSFAPYCIFGITLLIGASIPLFTTVFAGNPLSDLLTIVYLVALAAFFLALAGLDVGSAFGGFGSSREMTVAALTEGGLLFSLLAPALVAHTSNLFAISDVLSSAPLIIFAPLFFALLGFAIALLAETARFPFDNPATHLELTMIHEAMILEYSGKKLALMEWASANKLLIFLALGANLFFPWGISSSMLPMSILVSLGIFMGKVFLLGLSIAVLESSIAKFRLFRLPDVLFVSFILSVIAIGLI